MNGKVCVITGAASGIGQQLAIALAKQGATVIAVGRNAARADEAVRGIRASAGQNAKVEPLSCDLASIDSIKLAAEGLRARHPKIHLLVNNAATFNKERRISADGLELNYAINVLAPFLLTHLLLPALKAAAPSRVVNLTMAPTKPLDFDDLQAERGYSALKALQSTKSGHQYLTYGLAQRLEGSDVTVVTVNPGLTQSKLPSEAPFPLRLVFKLFGKTPEQGAKVPLTACLDPALKSGAFLSDKGVVAPMPSFIDSSTSQRFFAINTTLARL